MADREYKARLSAACNRKGVLEIDTVKGCAMGMQAYPSGGCYGACYAFRMARAMGFNFRKSISRKICDDAKDEIQQKVKRHHLSWFRIGTMGDPCHDWDLTIRVCEWLGYFKRPVVVTKHWIPLSGQQIKRLKNCNAIFNTSISALDTIEERCHRLQQHQRLNGFGLTSVLRVVTARFGSTEYGIERNKIQNSLLDYPPIIDTPLRISSKDARVLCGDIIAERRENLGGKSTISIANEKTYIGHCDSCPDQCGINLEREVVMVNHQDELFRDEIEFLSVKSVLGSGFENDIARLAIEDGIAHRAARKNMQIHSAVVLKINDEFAGFFTFQNNDEVKEFCLLQSVIRPDKYNPELYRKMVEKVIEQNTNNYPAIITTDPKSKFETPKLFESCGFKTYLIMSGFHYMVKGDLSSVRMKLLAHMTMTNVWQSTKGDWIRLKKEWNEQIESAGERNNIPNPRFASREGCWQGESGFSNVVLTSRTVEDGEIKVDKGKSLNKNASVLDPVACEIILRFFMPKDGRRIYNPFGGGVQFGFVAGSYGYEYVASEIRQNQCDCNNAICSDFASVKWVKSDSSTYSPDGLFDLIFTCPPYYRVEKYVDYDWNIPDGEINALSTYESFRGALFSGYKKAIEHLSENCFFVVMVGDSRAPNGSYYCAESETELFLKEQGLLVYNKIVYLESEFTRLAQAKKTLNHRKFPKREQKIIAAFKGKQDAIKELYVPLGRL